MKNLIFILSLFLASLLTAQEKAKSIFDIARSGTVAEVQALMKQNPDIVNQTNESGFTPLILACYRGNVEVAEFLIDHVKDVNYKSNEGTALAGLAIKYNRNLAERLLKKNADPNIADGTGSTPLFWAVKLGNKELIELLLHYKADKSIKDQMGMTPFEYALKTGKPEIINILKN
ncbi:ankyrin repeat domain-containing protein [Chryseobacterium pennipullorum]|uniref:Ankyrin repeat domain-containing protein n=1 Tax=Chryseobacterium pennipullorum TaxID=2258963 RepID=A0A3D9AQB7_9FLAO|nr:ankyrin repeat domain-containing protein [Chryseobacterium pennipullorum]REC43405.1 ankyrin repeat domain-containing protein [Chryseobacterium pennipullorum]